MKEILLSVSNLSIVFLTHKEEKMAVNGISFHIKKGDTLSLVGESGSGKSVCALSILKLLPPTAKHPSGNIFFEGKDLLSLKEEEMRRIRRNDIKIIFQDPMSSLNPVLTIAQQITEVLRLDTNISKADAIEKTVELLTEVDIQHPLKRLHSFPHELSGGERQRVMIAIAMANKPKLLIADEATTNLDVRNQEKIITLLKNIQQKHHMSMLFITHNLNLVKKISHHVCVMKHGHIVEKNSIETICSNPQHPYTKHLFTCLPKKTLPINNRIGSAILCAKNIHVWFPIKQNLFSQYEYIKAVDGVDVTIHENETLGLLGESGSGKTTLALAITRMIPSQGTILFHQNPIHHLSAQKMLPIRRSMQIVFQDSYGSLNPRMSITQIIEEGLTIYEPKMSQKEREKKVFQILEDVNLEPNISSRYPHELSGGQCQRIAIARAIIIHPTFMMLDEPTSSLDRSVQSELIQLLDSLQKKYRLSYCLISHDLSILHALADTIIVIQKGKIIESGCTEKILTTPQKEYTRQLIAALIE